MKRVGNIADIKADPRFRLWPAVIELVGRVTVHPESKDDDKN